MLGDPQRRKHYTSPGTLISITTIDISFALLLPVYTYRQYYLGVGCLESGIHGEGSIPYTPIQVAYTYIIVNQCIR